MGDLAGDSSAGPPVKASWYRPPFVEDMVDLKEVSEFVAHRNGITERQAKRMALSPAQFGPTFDGLMKQIGIPGDPDRRHPFDGLQNPDVEAELEKVGPDLASCYRQMVRDAADDARETFVGRAAELREVLTGVLHRLRSR
jgi:hypothetical protein